MSARVGGKRESEGVQKTNQKTKPKTGRLVRMRSKIKSSSSSKKTIKQFLKISSSGFLSWYDNSRALIGDA